MAGFLTQLQTSRGFYPSPIPYLRHDDIPPPVRVLVWNSYTIRDESLTSREALLLVLLVKSNGNNGASHVLFLRVSVVIQNADLLHSGGRDRPHMVTVIMAVRGSHEVTRAASWKAISCRYRRSPSTRHII